MTTLCRYVGEKISTNFHIISTYFCTFSTHDVILMRKKSTSFWCTLFDRISMSEKLILFRHTFFDIISMSEKSMSFQCTSFDLILMDKNIDVVSMYFFKQFWWKTDVNSKCWFWFVFEREKIVVVLTSLFQKFLIYQKLKPFELYFWT